MVPEYITSNIRARHWPSEDMMPGRPTSRRCMDEGDRDTLMRLAAFEHVRRLGEIHDHLTEAELKPGFIFEGQRIPFINPRRGIFKPKQMRFLLSITIGWYPNSTTLDAFNATGLWRRRLIDRGHRPPSCLRIHPKKFSRPGQRRTAAIHSGAADHACWSCYRRLKP
jgi:hypothetical protein